MEVTAEDLGKRSFCEAVKRARLPKAVFKELKKTIDYGAPLDAAIADYKVLVNIAKANGDKKGLAFYNKGIEELESGKKAFK